MACQGCGAVLFLLKSSGNQVLQVVLLSHHNQQSNRIDIPTAYDKNTRSVKYRTKLAFEVDGKAYEGEETYNQKVYVGDKVKVEVYRTSKGIYKLRPYNNLVNFVFYCVAIPLGFIIAIASVYSIGLIVKKKE